MGNLRILSEAEVESATGLAGKSVVLGPTGDFHFSFSRGCKEGISAQHSDRHTHQSYHPIIKHTVDRVRKGQAEGAWL